MNRNKIITLISTAAMATAMLTASNVAQAWNMGNMMNPGKWFDNDDDDYYRHHYYRGGYYGPYGPYGWGGGPYGWGGGPYGWGGYPGYGGAPSTIVVNPSDSSKSAPPPRLPE